MKQKLNTESHVEIYSVYNNDNSSDNYSDDNNNNNNNKDDVRATIRQQIEAINLEAGEPVHDAFFICDVGDVVKKWNRFRKCLPRVHPFYAMKCNPNPVMIEVLASLGANFDCASRGEMKAVLDAGIAPERVIFANPCKQASHIKYAEAQQVKMMTFDNEAELHKVRRLFPSADLVVRILVDDSKSTSKLGLKFGVSPSKAQHLLEVAKGLDLNVIGVSFHVGSGCYDATLFYEAVRSAKQVFEYAEELGFQFTLLDVGGGFPGTDTGSISFEEVSVQLNRGFEDFFPEGCGVNIMAEPGRFFCASAFTLVCNVTSVRGEASGCSEKESNEGFMYYINDGVYGSFNCILFDHQHPAAQPLDDGPLAGPLYKCSVWGPTCDSLDCITGNVALPKMEVGDWMFFENMGAYTMAAGSCFNGFQPPPIFYKCQDTLWQSIVGASASAILPAASVAASAVAEAGSTVGDVALSGAQTCGNFSLLMSASGESMFDNVLHFAAPPVAC